MNYFRILHILMAKVSNYGKVNYDPGIVFQKTVKIVMNRK